MLLQNVGRGFFCAPWHHDDASGVRANVSGQHGGRFRSRSSIGGGFVTGRRSSRRVCSDRDLVFYPASFGFRHAPPSIRKNGKAVATCGKAPCRRHGRLRVTEVSRQVVIL